MNWGTKTDSWDQPPRYQDILPDHPFGSPPPSFQLKGGKPSAPPVGVSSGSHSNNPALNWIMVVPPANTPLPTVEEEQVSPEKRGKQPTILKTTMMQADNATSHQCTPEMPEPTTLPGPKFRPLPKIPISTGPHPALCSWPALEPCPGGVQVPPLNNITSNARSDTSLQPHVLPPCPSESQLFTNLSQDSPDANSKRLEHLLDSALETALETALIIQTSGISISADILSPRAHNTLKALNALVSVETPVHSTRSLKASGPPSRFKSVRTVTKWLQTL